MWEEAICPLNSAIKAAGVLERGTAVAPLKKVVDLLPSRDPRREQVQQPVQQCQRQVILDNKLPAVLQGTEKPANAAERIEFAQLCALKKLHTAAARFYRDAFTADAKLA